MRSGREASVGKMSLYRHLKSRMSSAKPSKIIQQIDNKAAMNSTNQNKKKGKRELEYTLMK